MKGKEEILGQRTGERCQILMIPALIPRVYLDNYFFHVVRCLISWGGRSCRPWETGWSAMLSSKVSFCYQRRSLIWYFRQVMGRCKKSLGAGKEVVIDASTINAIFSRWSSSFTRSLSWLLPSPSVVALSESEPYGIRGGSLVVLFAPALNSDDSPVEVKFCRFSV